ncbi:MAG TPA: hemerythrin domain-containing protein, partial [Burkholderiaceae bacterium]|nr:hemerythrin domain-containing protein [Burkholderiaceae bacterium]
MPLRDQPVASFDDPIEMLSVCHGRMQHALDTLRRLEAFLSTRGPSEESASAASAVLRYFDIAAPLHHQDEDEDVYPALHACVAEDDPLRLTLQELHEEHQKLDELWAFLRTDLQAIAAGEAIHLDGALVRQFRDATQRHLAIEDSIVLPYAQRL